MLNKIKNLLKTKIKQNNSQTKQLGVFSIILLTLLSFVIPTAFVLIGYVASVALMANDSIFKKRITKTASKNLFRLGLITVTLCSVLSAFIPTVFVLVGYAVSTTLIYSALYKKPEKNKIKIKTNDSSTTSTNKNIKNDKTFTKIKNDENDEKIKLSKKKLLN